MMGLFTHFFCGYFRSYLNRFQGGDRGARDCLKDISEEKLDHEKKEQETYHSVYFHRNTIEKRSYM